jgi:hypothetical protein
MALSSSWFYLFEVGKGVVSRSFRVFLKSAAQDLELADCPQPRRFATMLIMATSLTEPY